MQSSPSDRAPFRTEGDQPRLSRMGFTMSAKA